MIGETSKRRSVLQSLGELLSLALRQGVPSRDVKIKTTIGAAVLLHEPNKLCIAKGKNVASE